MADERGEQKHRMCAQVSVQQVLSVTSTALNSFQIRTLAVEIEGCLHNLATVVEFSRWPVEVLKKNRQIQLQDDRIRKGPLIPFQSFHSAAKWSNAVADFKAGTLLFRESMVALVGELNLTKLTSRLAIGGWFSENETPYPLFEAMSVPGTQEQRDAAKDVLRFIEMTPRSEAVDMQMSRSGYHSYREFLHARFGSRAETEPTPGAVYVAIPVPAVVHDCYYDSANGLLKARALVAPELLDSTWVHGRMCFANPNVTYEVRFGSFHTEKSVMDVPDLVCCDAEWDLRKRCQSLDLRVVHHELGIVQSTRLGPSQLMLPSYSNPLFNLIKRFCTTEHVAQMLARPDPDKSGAPKPQRAYEQYVQWLLSLCGFNAVNLGSHEHLHDDVGGTKVRRGSLDIGAFHPERRMLLLASCTLKAPDEGDYSNLVNLRVSLAREIAPEAGVDVRLVIFTTAEAVADDPRYGFGEHHVVVFSASQVRAIVNELSNSEHPSLFDPLTGGKYGFHSIVP